VLCDMPFCPECYEKLKRKTEGQHSVFPPESLPPPKERLCKWERELQKKDLGDER